MVEIFKKMEFVLNLISKIEDFFDLVRSTGRLCCEMTTSQECSNRTVMKDATTNDLFSLGVTTFDIITLKGYR